ncbi:large ribosomal subunit protein eL20z isoform X4 [Lolium perenne]|uniref:large ribosomal subunit protein eL20z isoform X4 n=1 Tax=Lolium perenne TaxID=4522 RepID=UPI0021F53287|nr:60S ribosomal protein L18a-like protein isoform X4 [Lolium perenne]
MAAPPTAPQMEMGKPVPGQGSAPPFEPAKAYPYPYPGQDTEAGVRGHGYDRLPCCGLGIGWVLFILGFIFGAIPWYAGALLLCFYKRDRREKPGFIACAVAAVIGTILIIIAVVVPSEVRVHHY